MCVCVRDEGHVEKKCKKKMERGNKMAIKEVKIRMNDTFIYCTV